MTRFLDSSILKIIFFIIQINNFQGALTDVSAETEALLVSDSLCMDVLPLLANRIPSVIVFQPKYRLAHTINCSV